MKRLLLLILPLSLACQPHSSTTDANKIDSNTTTLTNPKTDVVDTSKKINLEYLDWKLATINNQIPVFCKKAGLIELLGRPDSLVTPNMNDICVSFFEKDLKFLYYGESQFETSGDSAVISSIHFDNNSKIKLNIGTIVLDNTMTLTKLASLYPNAVQLKEEATIDNGEKVILVRIACSKILSDDSWVLLFKDGKLIRLDYWMPC